MLSKVVMLSEFSDDMKNAVSTACICAVQHLAMGKKVHWRILRAYSTIMKVKINLSSTNGFCM